MRERMRLVYVDSIPESARGKNEGRSKYEGIVESFEASGEQFARIDGIDTSKNVAASTCLGINKAAKRLGAGVKACVRRGRVYMQSVED